MNCKPGDLAVVVGIGMSPALGMLVTCVAPYCGPWKDGSSTAGWTLDRFIPTRSGGFQNVIGDCYLRPIRDQPGADETLTWAGKPAETPADLIREVAA
jgi:hypothetical protein